MQPLLTTYPTMDEAAWQRCDRLFAMFAFAQDRLADRQRRLFAVACCRRLAHLLTDARSRHALDVAERFARGLASEEARREAEDLAFLAHIDARERWVVAGAGVPAWSLPAERITQAVALAAGVGLFASQDAADHARWALAGGGGGWRVEQVEEAAQCALLREIVGPALFRPVPIHPYWPLAHDGAAVQVAAAIDDGAADLYPILADALEDAGCNDSTILSHCREDADHVRGCWLIDLLLGEP